jgi:hypothetical protein
MANRQANWNQTFAGFKTEVEKHLGSRVDVDTVKVFTDDMADRLRILDEQHNDLVQRLNEFGGNQVTFNDQQAQLNNKVDHVIQNNESVRTAADNHIAKITEEHFVKIKNDVEGQNLKIAHCEL